MSGKHLSAALALMLHSTSAAVAHNEWGLLNPDLVRQGIITNEELARVAEQQEDSDARYVVERALLWEPGAVLKGCFLGGGSQQRKRVVDATEDLLIWKHVNISINYGQGPDYNNCEKAEDGNFSEPVRVSLESGCCAAYVGRTSIYSPVLAGPSVFLGGTPGKSAIQHEIMHALGLYHEFEKQDTACKFNIDAIAGAYGWDAEKVRPNVSELEKNSVKRPSSTLFDPDSIMRYYFSPAVLDGGVNSSCYAHQSVTASLEDYSALRTAYPVAFEISDHKKRIEKGRSLLSEKSDLPQILKNLIQTAE